MLGKEIHELIEHNLEHSSSKTNKAIEKLIQDAIDGNKIYDILVSSPTLLKIYPTGFDLVESLVRDTSFKPIIFYARTLLALRELISKETLPQKIECRCSDLIRYLEEVLRIPMWSGVSIGMFYVKRHNILAKSDILRDLDLAPIYSEFALDILAGQNDREKILQLFKKWKLESLADILFYIISQSSCDHILIEMLTREASSFSGIYRSALVNTASITLIINSLKDVYSDDKIKPLYRLLNTCRKSKDADDPLYGSTDTAASNVPLSTDLHEILGLFKHIDIWRDFCEDDNLQDYLCDLEQLAISSYTIEYPNYISQHTPYLEESEDEDDDLPSPDKLKESKVKSFLNKYNDIVKQAISPSNLAKMTSSLKNTITSTISYVKKNGVSEPMGRQFGNVIGKAINHLVGPNISGKQKYGTNHLMKAIAPSTNGFKGQARSAIIKQLLRYEYDKVDDAIEDTDDRNSQKTLKIIQNTLETQAEDNFDLELDRGE